MQLDVEKLNEYHAGLESIRRLLNMVGRKYFSRDKAGCCPHLLLFHPEILIQGFDIFKVLNTVVSSPRLLKRTD